MCAKNIKCDGDVQNASLTPEKELNTVIHKTLSVIIHMTYENCPLFGPPCIYVLIFFHNVPLRTVFPVNHLTDKTYNDDDIFALL